MKTYKCHKIVRAARVVNIERHAPSPDYDQLFLDDKSTIPVKRESQFKHTEPGDYYVVYDDSYASRSPAAAFEAGYAEVIDREPGVVDGELLRSTDAADVWATEFAKIHPEIDRGTMIAWFANCAEGAKDLRRWRDRERARGEHVTDTHEPTERSLQLAATAWCGPNTSHIEMDSRIAYEFAKILDRVQKPA